MRLVIALVAAALAVPATTAAPRTPVLLELFTSEGCSSCPPADALLAALLRDQPLPDVEIVPLSLHVDYWDHQGWKDPFSSRAFTARQQAYSRIFGEDRVYTPQMVVDGRDEFTGSDERAARRALASAASRPHLPLKVDARVQGLSVRLSIDLPAAPAETEPIEALVALTEDDLASIVKRGENVGRTLTHVAVVRSLEALGALEREAFVANGQVALNRGWNAANMRAVAWLQGKKTKHVYGTARSPLAR
ncbi:MAG TPA: DUF1223 domain-containing protein [Vicinamibacterales bacterium]|jgi:hypothetical protein